MQELEKNLAEHAAAADAAVIALRESPPTLIELRARSRAEAKSPFTAYLSLDIPEDAVEMLMEKEGKTVAAVKVSANDNRMFVEGNAAIHQSQERYDIPYFKPHLTDLGDGGWRVNYDFKRVPAGQALPANLMSLLKSAVLIKPGARHEYFRQLTRKGRFPAPVQISDEQRVFRWLTPQCDRPELLVTEVRLTKDNQIASASWGNSTAVEMKCGSRGELKFTPPVWPDLPLAKKEGADVSTVGQLMFYGLSVWQSIEFFTDGDTAYGPWVSEKESK
jgi:hypothetical protein